jgi:hypothetical protein
LSLVLLINKYYSDRFKRQRVGLLLSRCRNLALLRVYYAVIPLQPTSSFQLLESYNRSEENSISSQITAEDIAPSLIVCLPLHSTSPMRSSKQPSLKQPLLPSMKYYPIRNQLSQSCSSRKSRTTHRITISPKK